MEEMAARTSTNFCPPVHSYQNVHELDEDNLLFPILVEGDSSATLSVPVSDISCIPVEAFRAASKEEPAVMTEQDRAVPGMEKTLGEMLVMLSRLDSFLVSDCSPCPTQRQFRLLLMIWLHVQSQILQFLMEMSTKAKWPPLENTQSSVKALYHYCHEKLRSGEGSIINPATVDDKLFEAWYQLSYVETLCESSKSHLQKLLQSSLDISASLPTVASDVNFHGEVRKRVADNMLLELAGLPSGGQNKRTRSVGATTGVSDTLPSASIETPVMNSGGDVLEQRLCGLWLGLVSLSCQRSYAPPSATEINYYREIRKRVVSSIGCICTKPAWRRARGSECSEKWFTTSAEMLYVHFYFIPMGWRLALALGEIPELVSLVREGGQCLSGIFREESMGISASGKREVTIRSFQSPEVYELHLLDGLTRAADSSKEKKTRKEYLEAIISTLKHIDWKSEPTVEEGRLIMQIVEHVRSSIFLFRGDIAICFLPSSNENRSLFEGSAAGIDAGDDGNVQGEKGETTMSRTRRQCLEEIISSIEAIRLFFTDTPPTDVETRYYELIKVYFLRPMMKVHSKRLNGGSGGGLMSTPFGMCVLKDIRHSFDRCQVRLFKLLTAEVEVMAKGVFPGVESLDALAKMLTDLRPGSELMSDVLRQLQPKFLESPEQSLAMLDQALWILQKVNDVLSQRLFNRLQDLNLRREMQLQSGDYEEMAYEYVGAAEAWDSLLTMTPELSPK